ncbi:importin-4-like isoform X2 [Venturia canescens]|uniref:importin-4-like isoform X2 n=1 Tax=Venturia canescens TaxID=32260 RepID=UPI001C9C5AAB|nr:importin-4-like isoform X2 [Venturia canescens]
MEATLQKLLESDENVKQPTEELRETFKNPESSSLLFQLMVASQNPMIRQYAAVLLKKRHSQLKNWTKLPVEARTQAKQLVVQSLSEEADGKVQKAVVELTRTIVKHESPNNGCPQIFETIKALASSGNLAKKELGMYAIEKTAGTVPSAYVDRSASIVDILIEILQPPTEGTKSLLVQAVKSLAALVRHVESASLRAANPRFLEIGLELVQSTNDPEVRKTVYGLLASISRVLKKNMAPALPRIVDSVIEGLSRAEDAVNNESVENPSLSFPVFDVGSDLDEGDEDVEDSDDEDAARRGPRSPWVEEKIEAISALRQMAESSEEAFLPSLKKSFDETLKLTIHSDADVREAAIDALLQFSLNLSKFSGAECREELSKALSLLVPKLSHSISHDPEKSVAMSGMWAYAKMLKEINNEVLLGDGHRAAIVQCVSDVLMEKTECQGRANVAGKNCENDDVEGDETLTEYASEVFSALGKVILPEDFAEYFRAVFPTLAERCASYFSPRRDRPSRFVVFIVRLFCCPQKSKKREARRSMAVGMIAKCMSGLKHASGAFVEQLLPLFYQSSSDECRCVRHNAFWGLGELVLHSKEAMFGRYESVLSLTETALARETEAGPRDNMIGLIARMIITNYSILEINRVFSLFVEKLPLRQDFVEYEAVFAAVSTLFRANHEIIKPAQLRDLLKLAIDVLYDDKAPNDETRETIIGFVKSVNRDFSEIYNAVHSQLPPKVATNLMHILS